MPSYEAGANNEIVPFGKYRGLPIETMLADQNYLEWVTTQPGIMAMLQSKHPAVFNIVTIGTPATSDTPEHNRLSSLFLNEKFQYAFIEIVAGKSVYDIGKHLADAVDKETANNGYASASAAAQEVEVCAKKLQEARIEHNKYMQADPNTEYKREKREWSKKKDERAEYYRTAPHYYPRPCTEFASYEKWLDAQECGTWPYYAKRKQEEVEKIEQQLQESGERLQEITTSVLVPTEVVSPKITLTFECGYDLDFRVSWHIKGPEFWENSGEWHYDGGVQLKGWCKSEIEKTRVKHYKIELKPQLGDDFPGVLRQMKRTESDTLVIGSFKANGCTIEEVGEMFATNEIHIVTLDEIKAVIDRIQVPTIREC